jgi:hypothetical protein
VIGPATGIASFNLECSRMFWKWPDNDDCCIAEGYSEMSSVCVAKVCSLKAYISVCISYNITFSDESDVILVI